MRNSQARKVWAKGFGNFLDRRRIPQKFVFRFHRSLDEAFVIYAQKKGGNQADSAENAESAAEQCGDRQ